MKISVLFWPAMVLVVGIVIWACGSKTHESMTRSESEPVAVALPQLDDEHRQIFTTWRSVDRPTQQAAQEWLRQTLGLPANCQIHLLSLASNSALINNALMGFVTIGALANEKPFLPVRTFIWRWQPDNPTKPMSVGPIETANVVDIQHFYAPIAEAVGDNVLSYIGLGKTSKKVIVIARPKTTAITDKKGVRLWIGESYQSLHEAKILSIQLFGPTPRVVIETDDQTLDWTLEGATRYGDEEFIPFPEQITLKHGDKVLRKMLYRHPLLPDQDDVKIKVDGKDMSDSYHL